MYNEFGRHFINIREYLMTYGLDDAKITPTDVDNNITIANGVAVPPSLLMDSIHVNSDAKNIIANLVVDRMKELNMI